MLKVYDILHFGGFLWSVKVYSAECKAAIVNGYLSRNISIRAFCNEKGICISSFVSWLTKVREFIYTKMNMIPKYDSSLTPIEVTNEGKTIVKEECINPGTFSLETKGMNKQY